MTRSSKIIISAIAVWVALPWFFWAIAQFHRPSHADPFWLPAMPLVVISFIPQFLGYNEGPGWMPLSLVVKSSAFNLIAGFIIGGAIAMIARRKART